MYHSMHENFHWLSKYVDPDFRYHLTVGKMWIKLGLLLADSLILPFNLSRAANKLNYYAKKFADDHKSILQPQGISSGMLKIKVKGTQLHSIQTFLPSFKESKVSVRS